MQSNKQGGAKAVDLPSRSFDLVYRRHCAWSVMNELSDFVKTTKYENYGGLKSDRLTRRGWVIQLTDMVRLVQWIASVLQHVRTATVQLSCSAQSTVCRFRLRTADRVVTRATVPKRNKKAYIISLQ